MRMPVSMTLLGAATTTRMLTIGVVSSGKTSARIYPFADQIIGCELCQTKYDILNQPIGTQRTIKTWRLHYDRLRPHNGLRNGLRNIILKHLRLAGGTG